MKKFKRITAILICAALIVMCGGVAYATNGSVWKELSYRDIKITLNGNTITPKDANGTVVEPFIIDGTTYLPVRAISDALGLDVQWDSNSSTVILSAKQASQQSEYHIGETWTVPGQWSVTITGVHETSDRNRYSDKKPTAVYVVEYKYTNLGYLSDFSDGKFISLEMGAIVDSANSMGYSYPGTKTKYPKEAPVGATCEAEAIIGVEHRGTFKITYSTYDGNDTKQSAVFVIDAN